VKEKLPSGLKELQSCMNNNVITLSFILSRCLSYGDRPTVTGVLALSTLILNDV